MASVPFDTLKAINRLRKAGFDESQAKAIIDTVIEAFAANPATKDDIPDPANDEDVHGAATSEVVADIRRNMLTKQDLHEFEVRFTIWMTGLIIAVAGIAVAAISLPS